MPSFSRVGRLVSDRDYHCAAASAEHEDVASEQIAAEAFLHKQHQTLHAFSVMRSSA
jgi:hypothetical protein